MTAIQNPPRRRSRTRRLLTGTVVTVVALTVLGACGLGGGDEAASGGDSSGADMSDGVVQQREMPQSEGAPGGALERDARADEGSGKDGIRAEEPGAVGRTVVQTRAVIRTGEVALVTKTMNQARDTIDQLLARHGGYLASEDTMNDRSGRPQRSVLVMRVPEPAFDTMMGGLTEIGRTERADRRSEDVTTQVIDVDARVATQEASLARLQRFLRQATNINDMIRLESEIASRQAELESLKAQQKYLSDQTAMSTITARLRTPAAPPPEKPDEDRGFLVGLSAGWTALLTVLVGAATVAGAVLPFAAAAVLVGVPVWLLVRAAVRRRVEPALSPPGLDTPGPDAS